MQKLRSAQGIRADRMVCVPLFRGSTHILTLCVAGAAFGVGCGSRTGLEGYDVYGDGSSFGAGDGAEAASGVPSACPVCTGDTSCSTPHACVEPGGCTYSWCGHSIGYASSSMLCAPEAANSGLCVTPGMTELCILVGPVTCVWPLAGDPPSACRGNEPNAGEPCGNVRCGSGCQCLCENLCLCGDS